MKKHVLFFVLLFSVNLVFARAGEDEDANADDLVKVCLVHGAIYQVVPRFSSCITSNAFYDLIEHSYNNNLYDYNIYNSFHLRFYDIAPDPRVEPNFYHGNYEVRAIQPHDPDCFENEMIY